MEIIVSKEVRRDLEDIARTILTENVNEKRSDYFIVVREGTPEFKKYEDEDFFYSFTLDEVLFHVSTH
jgi:hypothetical protein